MGNIMERLSGDLVRHKLATRVFGQNVVSVDQIGSTNTELKQLARQGAPEGLLYLAEEQLAGRGRLKERKWLAPARSSLLLSLLFRPAEIIAPNQAQQLTMLCALAMLEAVEQQTGLKPDLKWPNDLLWIDGKKLAGILTEAEIEANRLNWVVVGIGLNVNLDFNQEIDWQQPAEKTGNGEASLSKIATSLSMILGRDTSADRLPILQRFLKNVEQRYEQLRQGRLFHREWGRCLAGLGHLVTVTGPDKVYQGILVGVDEDGALLLKQSDGSTKFVLAGDLEIL